MLRETKSFEIQGLEKPVTVYELTVEQLIELLGGSEGRNVEVRDLRSLFTEKILPRVTDLTTEDLMRLGPSRIKLLWEHVKEVNAAFFDLARAVGLDGVVEQVRDHFTASFSGLLANSSKPATSKSGDTDSASTSTP